MGIRPLQQTLDQYYAVRDDLLSGKMKSYTIGDRTVTLQDMDVLEKIIQQYENAILSGTPIYADFGGINGPLWPFGFPTTGY